MNRNGMKSLEFFIKGLKFAKRYPKHFLNRFFLDKHTKQFINFNKVKWPKNYYIQKDLVLLLGLCDWRPSIYCYSHVTNYIAKKTNSEIELFSFSKFRNVELEKVYASFGAHLGLSLGNADLYKKLATELAESVFNSLTSKWDVLNISVEGVVIGDLIYDTYLRRLVRPTVDLKDKELKKFILDAILIFYACKDYLSRKKVVAIFPDHTVYIDSGILVRLASLREIPIYIAAFRPKFRLIQLDTEMSEGMPNNAKRWPYYRFKELFDQFDPVEKECKRTKGRKALLDRLSGKIDDKGLPTYTAYADSTNEKVLENSNEPRIVILLHDFCDSVHCYRSMLFPDFYEWIHFLLERAEKTRFQWYAKPHPVSLTDPRKNVVNSLVVEELKQKFPRVKFLDASVSNRQIVSDGVSAMFTVHGTAGHEFAYMGVPVVNAGDNLHIAYNFNLHPKTIEEYESYIHTANSLKLNINKAEVEEFFYMQSFYFHESNVFNVNPIDEDLVNSKDFMKESFNSKIFDYFIEDDSAAKDKELRAYFDRFFANLDGLKVKDT